MVDFASHSNGRTGPAVIGVGMTNVERRAEACESRGTRMQTDESRTPRALAGPARSPARVDRRSAGLQGSSRPWEYLRGPASGAMCMFYLAMPQGVSRRRAGRPQRFTSLHTPREGGVAGRGKCAGLHNARRLLGCGAKIAFSSLRVPSRCGAVCLRLSG